MSHLAAPCPLLGAEAQDRPRDVLWESDSQQPRHSLGAGSDVVPEVGPREDVVEPPRTSTTHHLPRYRSGPQGRVEQEMDIIRDRISSSGVGQTFFGWRGFSWGIAMWEPLVYLGVRMSGWNVPGVGTFSLEIIYCGIVVGYMRNGSVCY